MPKTTVRYTTNIPRILGQSKARTQEIIRITAHAIETRVKTGMAEPHSGRWYGRHQASKPGDMPAVDTGLLMNSIQVEHNETFSTVFTNTEYAIFQEYGTRKMEARPFMEPAAKAEWPFYVARMKGWIQ